MSSSEWNRKPGFRFLEQGDESRQDSGFYRAREAAVAAVANCLVKAVVLLHYLHFWVCAQGIFLGAFRCVFILVSH